MSGIFAFTGRSRAPRTEAALARLAWLGGDLEEVVTNDVVTVAVTRKAWEAADDFAGDVGVLETPELIVAADAAIYDRPALIRALARERVAPSGLTPTHLIEAAYRAWGAEAAAHLNGDYAFVIWDRARHRLVAARDPIGMRPLFVTALDGGHAVGSSARALAEHAGRSESLDVAYLGAQVAGLMWENGTATAYRGVAPLPAGHCLVLEGGKETRLRFWSPPSAPGAEPCGLEEAAAELRELIGLAVADRSSSGLTTVWMSGGWDSTAVFAAGQARLAAAERHRLRPVSISYPAGDPGREDELIAQVAGRWGSTVQWLHSEEIPLLDALEERAAAADEPPAHPYELWNAALARGTRALGGRVALDGCGGDNLFQVSDVVLADFLRAGRLLSFARGAEARKGMGWRYIARMGVLPLLPDGVVRTLERMAGRRLPRHYMEHAAAPWVRREFLAAHGLRDRALAVLRSERGASLAQTENMLYLTAPAWGWAGGYMRGVLLQEGVEVRSPLLDLRIAEFALRRPVSERTAGAETKILLRKAMQGLLPAEVLAPRPRRTGSTAGYSRRRMREAYPALLDRLFAEPLRVAALGIVDEPSLRAAAQRWREAGDDSVRMALFNALRVEFWLRGRERPTQSGRRRRAIARRLDATTAA